MISSRWLRRFFCYWAQLNNWISTNRNDVRLAATNLRKRESEKRERRETNWIRILKKSNMASSTAFVFSSSTMTNKRRCPTSFFITDILAESNRSTNVEKIIESDDEFGLDSDLGEDLSNSDSGQNGIRRKKNAKSSNSVYRSTIKLFRKKFWTTKIFERSRPNGISDAFEIVRHTSENLVSKSTVKHLTLISN